MEAADSNAPAKKAKRSRLPEIFWSLFVGLTIFGMFFYLQYPILIILPITAITIVASYQLTRLVTKARELMKVVKSTMERNIPEVEVIIQNSKQISSHVKDITHDAKIISHDCKRALDDPAYSTKASRALTWFATYFAREAPPAPATAKAGAKPAARARI